MKAFGVLLMLVVTTVVAVAQSPAPGPVQAGLTILKFNCHRNFRRSNWDKEGTVSQMSRGVLMTKRGEFIKEYVYEVTIQNNSMKTVVAIEWDYVFTDPMTQNELARHSFRSTKRIPPGRKKTLTGSTLTPEIPVIMVKAVEENPNRPYGEKVVVRTVESRYEVGEGGKGKG